MFVLTASTPDRGEHGSPTPDVMKVPTCRTTVSSVSKIHRPRDRHPSHPQTETESDLTDLEELLLPGFKKVDGEKSTDEPIHSGSVTAHVAGCATSGSGLSPPHVSSETVKVQQITPTKTPEKAVDTSITGISPKVVGRINRLKKRLKKKQQVHRLHLANMPVKSERLQAKLLSDECYPPIELKNAKRKLKKEKDQLKSNKSSKVKERRQLHTDLASKPVLSERLQAKLLEQKFESMIIETVQRSSVDVSNARKQGDDTPSTEHALKDAAKKQKQSDPVDKFTSPSVTSERLQARYLEFQSPVRASSQARMGEQSPVEKRLDTDFQVPKRNSITKLISKKRKNKVRFVQNICCTITVAPSDIEIKRSPEPSPPRSDNSHIEMLPMSSPVSQPPKCTTVIAKAPRSIDQTKMVQENVSNVNTEHKLTEAGIVTANSVLNDATRESDKPDEHAESSVAIPDSQKEGKHETIKSHKSVTWDRKAQQIMGEKLSKYMTEKAKAKSPSKQVCRDKSTELLTSVSDENTGLDEPEPVVFSDESMDVVGEVVVGEDVGEVVVSAGADEYKSKLQNVGHMYGLSSESPVRPEEHKAQTLETPSDSDVTTKYCTSVATECAAADLPPHPVADNVKVSKPFIGPRSKKIAKLGIPCPESLGTESDEYFEELPPVEPQSKICKVRLETISPAVLSKLLGNQLRESLEEKMRRKKHKKAMKKKRHMEREAAKIASKIKPRHRLITESDLSDSDACKTDENISKPKPDHPAKPSSKKPSTAENTRLKDKKNRLDSESCHEREPAKLASKIKLKHRLITESDLSDSDTCETDKNSFTSKPDPVARQTGKAENIKYSAENTRSKEKKKRSDSESCHAYSDVDPTRHQHSKKRHRSTGSLVKSAVKDKHVMKKHTSAGALPNRAGGKERHATSTSMKEIDMFASIRSKMEEEKPCKSLKKLPSHKSCK